MSNQTQQVYTFQELKDKMASHEYGAELLLQHAMILLENQQWQPIETCPFNLLVDVWVASKNNADYRRRAADLAQYSQGKFSGMNPPNSNFGEHATHWKPRPKPPKVKP